MTMNNAKRKGSLIQVGLGYLLILAILVTLGCLLYALIGAHLGWPQLSPQDLALHGFGIWFAISWTCPAILLVWDRLAVSRSSRFVGTVAETPVSPLSKASDSPDIYWLPELKEYLRENYSLLKRRKVRFLLVVGEPEQVEAIAPDLEGKKWLIGHDTLLLWGGSLQSKFDDSHLEAWR
ncbi:TPA: type VI secretion protein VasK, partial [Pseudomonas putida]|nr:type VI secretion protein VasK [Pseudomonas putida]